MATFQLVPLFAALSMSASINCLLFMLGTRQPKYGVCQHLGDPWKGFWAHVSLLKLYVKFMCYVCMHVYLGEGTYIFHQILKGNYINRVVQAINPASLVAQMVRICLLCRRPDPCVGKTSWRKEWLPTPALLTGERHRQRKLGAYSPEGRKESSMTEQLTLTFYTINLPNRDT